ncbi:hypothetical protein [Polaromonas sp. CG9_12]|nr:hypothetical protein [Polaromonas sp. CG9_12]
MLHLNCCAYAVRFQQPARPLCHALQTLMGLLALGRVRRHV